jgi:hypothetical protein
VAKFDFLSAFEADVKRCPNNGGWEDDRFYYRRIGNDFHIAIKAHFDRWANSVDFVFAAPKTANAYEKLKQRLEDAMNKKQYDSGWGQELRI